MDLEGWGHRLEEESHCPGCDGSPPRSCPKTDADNYHKASFNGTCTWLGNFLLQGTRLPKSSRDQWLVNLELQRPSPHPQSAEASFVTDCTPAFPSTALFYRWVSWVPFLVQMQPSILVSVSRELSGDGLEGIWREMIYQTIDEIEDTEPWNRCFSLIGKHISFIIAYFRKSFWAPVQLFSRKRKLGSYPAGKFRSAEPLAFPLMPETVGRWTKSSTEAAKLVCSWVDCTIRQTPLCSQDFSCFLSSSDSKQQQARFVLLVNEPSYWKRSIINGLPWPASELHFLQNQHLVSSLVYQLRYPTALEIYQLHWIWQAVSYLGWTVDFKFTSPGKRMDQKALSE